MQNEIFKDQLAIFLLKKWQKDQYGIILGKKRLVLSHGGNCVHLSYSNNIEKMVVGHPEQLQDNHEKADTLIAFHAVNVTGNIVVKPSDNDALVILLGMLGKHMECQRDVLYGHIIMDCGIGNNRRYIDINKIATSLESTQKGLTTAIPGLHALTG